MGFAAVGAVLAGTATVGETMAAVATVGAVTGVVGAVTGNKTMQKIGGVMGLVGGVGSLAAGAFAGTADTIAGGVADAASNSAADYATMGYGATADAATEGLADFGSSAGDFVAPGMNDMVQQATQDARTVEPIDVSSSQPAMAPSQDAYTPPDYAKSAYNPTNPTVANPVSPTPPSAPTPNPVTPSSVGIPVDSPKVDQGSFFDGMKGVFDWMQKNPRLAGTMMTVGGSMLENAFKPDYDQQYIDLQKRRLDMMQSTMSTPASHPARVGAGGYYAGIVNGARQ